MSPLVIVVASSAPPVLSLGELLVKLRESGWEVGVMLTPTAATWVDTDSLTEAAGNPVRVRSRLPHEPKPLRDPDAVIAAPVTLNSLNKWAAGIGDTTAAGFLNESICLDIPVIAAPNVSQKLRRHPAYPKSLETLTSAGVTVLDPDTTMIRPADDHVTMDWNLIMAALPNINHHH